jgi:hypothetical protein
MFSQPEKDDLLRNGRLHEVIKGMALHPVGIVDTSLPEDVTTHNLYITEKIFLKKIIYDIKF